MSHLFHNATSTLRTFPYSKNSQKGSKLRVSNAQDSEDFIEHGVAHKKVTKRGMRPIFTFHTEDQIPLNRLPLCPTE